MSEASDRMSARSEDEDDAEDEGGPADGAEGEAGGPAASTFGSSALAVAKQATGAAFSQMWAALAAKLGEIGIIDYTAKVSRQTI